jgi:D-alanyl-D-alanine carboxypeptidase
MSDPSSGALAGQLDATLLACWQRLGIPERLLTERNLTVFEEPASLELAETGSDGRKHFLERQAATAWSRMKRAALNDSVDIHIVSAFRSIERQIEILESKLNAGHNLDSILAVSAPPGCSEHHSGQAIDIGTRNCTPLEAEFERTAAFRWLETHGSQHGFRLSYPPGNAQGYEYEPWHWCYVAG